MMRTRSAEFISVRWVSGVSGIRFLTVSRIISSMSVACRCDGEEVSGCESSLSTVVFRSARVELHVAKSVVHVVNVVFESGFILRQIASSVSFY